MPPSSATVGSVFYAYRVKSDAAPVECLTGHPIKPGEVVLEPFRGRLISLCGPCASEILRALHELHQAENARKAG